MLFPANRLSSIQAIIPLLDGSELWDNRFEIEWYVNRCELAGFCTTDDLRRACAKRYIAGKRKITPPGTRKKKESLKLQRKILLNPPEDLLISISKIISGDLTRQYLSGNTKVLNSMIGMVLKEYKTEPNIIKQLLLDKLSILQVN